MSAFLPKPEGRPPKKQFRAPPRTPANVLPNLAPVSADLQLFSIPVKDWKKAPYSFRKRDLLDRLVRYASTRDLERVHSQHGSSLHSFTIDNILSALKQIHYSRPPDGRWGLEEFVENNGIYGDDWDQE